jgi:hypothetical protein
LITEPAGVPGARASLPHQDPTGGEQLDLRGKTANQQADQTKREVQRLQYLFKKVLLHLLRKPALKWTKEELWQAIELFFKRPSGGMIHWRIYAALEAKLKGEPVDPYYFPLPRKKGRPVKLSKEEYKMQWESTQRLRQQIALERKVAIDKVRYKEVARRMAERSFANRGLEARDYEIRSLANRFETHYKALNKKKKSGEI